MSDRIDFLLNRLQSRPSDHDLSRLESAVWARINGEKRADVFGSRALTIQLGVSFGALVIGLLMAQFAGYDPMPRVLHSELVVLSDDSAFAPSVLLEGGI